MINYVYILRTNKKWDDKKMAENKNIENAKAQTLKNCDRKCKSCADMKKGFCSIIFEVA